FFVLVPFAVRHLIHFFHLLFCSVPVRYQLLEQAVRVFFRFAHFLYSFRLLFHFAHHLLYNRILLSSSISFDLWSFLIFSVAYLLPPGSKGCQSNAILLDKKEKK